MADGIIRYLKGRDVGFSKFLKFSFASALLCSAASISANALTNQDILGLLAAGLGEETIVAKIETSDVSFETGVEDLISLKNAGVPGPVIAAMVTAQGNKESAPQELSMTSPDPMVPHYAGVYLINSSDPSADLTKIESVMTSQTKTGGFFGYAFTGGIASASLKAVIQGESAKVDTSAKRPEFFFFFDDSNVVEGSQQSGTFAAGSAISMQSPSEFTLIELKQKKERREARFGSFNIAGAKTGIMDKDRIPFKFEPVRPGVFRVQPEGDLEPGEYGFVYAISAGTGPGMMAAGTASARVFDFTVE